MTERGPASYYSRRKETLLNRFDRTASLMREWLLDRYGAEFATTLRQEIRQEFEQLIPDIPYIPGPRARPLNAFLRITAQELAVYRVLKKFGEPCPPKLSCDGHEGRSLPWRTRCSHDTLRRGFYIL